MPKHFQAMSTSFRTKYKLRTLKKKVEENDKSEKVSGSRSQARISKHKRYSSQDGGIRRLSESKKKAKKRVERINMNAKEGGDVYGSLYVS